GIERKDARREVPSSPLHAPWSAPLLPDGRLRDVSRAATNWLAGRLAESRAVSSGEVTLAIGCLRGLAAGYGPAGEDAAGSGEAPACDAGTRSGRLVAEAARWCDAEEAAAAPIAGPLCFALADVGVDDLWFELEEVWVCWVDGCADPVGLA